MKFKKDEKVIIHNLGDGKEYRAIVKGISNHYPACDFYIIKMIDNFRDPDYGFDYCCISESCLKLEENR